MKKILLTVCLLTGVVAIPFTTSHNIIAQTTKKKQPRMGTVNSNGVAGAISKEADKLLTQYANNNDEEGIALMLLQGYIVYLPKGERVTLIEYGFATLKIRTKGGQVLYVPREHITLDKE